VGHPADVITVVGAWLAVLALLVAAVLFGQTARTAPPRPRRRRRRRPSRAARIGLFVSLSGPWLAAILGATVGVLTHDWLSAAAVAACGIVLAAFVGVALRPR
jgi:hypothetical protein